jgi:TonB family protein
MCVYEVILMWRSSVTTAVMAMSLGLLTLSSAIAQQTEAKPVNSASVYPDSPGGLKALLDDILAAMKTDNKAKASELLDSLAIPDYKTWFVKEFGSAEGQRLASKYEEVVPQLRGETERLFQSSLRYGTTAVTVTALQKPLDPNVRGLGRAIVEAMQEPITFYDVAGRSPTQQYPSFLGNYFYVQNAFRYVNGRVLQALSTAPPPRLRLGGQVIASKLSHKVDPIYPAEARASRIEGSVILHAIIGTDGHVKELNLVSGDPALVDAAMSAVRQWQYQPTKVNDVPAEIDTTITITFQMR